MSEVESWSTTLAPKQVQIEGYAQDQIGYHAWMLAEEGLLEGVPTHGVSSAVHGLMPRCLTPKGHDFLEAARNPTRWERAKEKLMAQGLPLTVKVLGTFLQESVKAELGKLTGGE